MLRRLLSRDYHCYLFVLPLLLAACTVSAQSSISFTNLPTVNFLTSNTGHIFTFNYLGPFNTAAYPGESGVNPQPALCLLTSNGVTTPVTYTTAVWSASTWWGTKGPAPLTNIAYASISASAAPNSTNNFTAMSAGIFFVYKVTGPTTINGSNNYGISVQVANGSGYFGPMVESVAAISGPDPGSGTVTGTDGGLPSSLTATQAAHAKPVTVTMPASTGGAVWPEVPMVNGVGYLYIGATVSVTGSITIGQIEDLDSASGTSDYETVIEAVFSP